MLLKLRAKERFYFISFLLIINILPVFTQEAADSINLEDSTKYSRNERSKSAFNWYFEKGLLHLNSSDAANLGVSKYGHSWIFVAVNWQFGLRFLKYGFVDVCYKWYHFKDTDPFTTTVEVYKDGYPTGKTYESSSEIKTVTVFGEVGTILPVFKRYDFSISSGVQTGWGNRYIPKCSDCRVDDLDLGTDYFLRFRLLRYSKQGPFLAYGSYRFFVLNNSCFKNEYSLGILLSVSLD
jgi:hypothetical protein